jgi:hypothetical protein
MYDVSQASGRFEYFLLIFAHRPVLDAEFNFASNGDALKESRSGKVWASRQNTVFLILFS